MDAVAKLKALADENNVSFEELCVYALGSAQQEAKEAQKQITKITIHQKVMLITQHKYGVNNVSKRDFRNHKNFAIILRSHEIVWERKSQFYRFS
jgi:monoamine oxidase